MEVPFLYNTHEHCTTEGSGSNTTTHCETEASGSYDFSAMQNAADAMPVLAFSLSLMILLAAVWIAYKVFSSKQ